MNAIKSKKIAIVGGGPGGLTLARLLQLHGAEVTVYERDAARSVRVQGATLDLHDESGLKALKEAGLMDAFKANYRPGADRMRITDKMGHILLDDDAGGEKEMSRPEIDRGPLRDILLDSLQPGTVRWDSHFTGMQQQEASWQLEFKNGTTAIADIVIAADGANSKLRPLITPIKPFYSGMTIVEGTVYNAAEKVPELNRLLNGGKIFALGDERSLIISAKGDGSLVFYTGCKTDEYWGHDSGIDFTDKVQVGAWFRETFTGWSSLWNDLFEKGEPLFILRPQYCMPPDQAWTSLPNLTMLGDAAHLMPPYAGEGVNMAMLDALELAQCLTNEKYTSAGDAIAAYEKEMRRRAAAVIKLTLEQTAVLHSPGAIAHMMNMMQPG